jgi:hypothetical protein
MQEAQTKGGRTVWHNKKSHFPVQMMLIALGILLWSLAVPYTAQAFWWQDWWKQELWWEQEIPPPDDPNQVINPEYIKTQENLKQTWYQLHRQNNATNQHYRWTRRNRTKAKNDNRTFRDATRLERKLKKTPMYVEQGAPPAPGPEPAEEIILKY